MRPMRGCRVGIGAHRFKEATEFGPGFVGGTEKSVQVGIVRTRIRCRERQSRRSGIEGPRGAKIDPLPGKRGDEHFPCPGVERTATRIRRERTEPRQAAGSGLRYRVSLDETRYGNAQESAPDRQALGRHHFLGRQERLVPDAFCQPYTNGAAFFRRLGIFLPELIGFRISAQKSDVRILNVLLVTALAGACSLGGHAYAQAEESFESDE